MVFLLFNRPPLFVYFVLFSNNFAHKLFLYAPDESGLPIMVSNPSRCSLHHSVLGRGLSLRGRFVSRLGLGNNCLRQIHLWKEFFSFDFIISLSGSSQRFQFFFLLSMWYALTIKYDRFPLVNSYTISTFSFCLKKPSHLGNTQSHYSVLLLWYIHT